MEGRFESGPRAPLAVIGQPNVAERKLDNPIELPAMLSYIAYGDFSADVRGLDSFPEDEWPTNIELLYYGFHVMVGPRHAVHRRDGARRAPASAPEARVEPLAALDPRASPSPSRSSPTPRAG